MAQLLYDRQSSKKHVNAVKRHMRLCRQIEGGDKYVVEIEPYCSVLIEKQQASEQASFEKMVAYDNVVLNDTILDNLIRTLFEKTKQFDRENPGRSILIHLFPDEKMTTIIYAPLKDEPTLVEQLIVRIEALGAEHPLYAEKTDIQAKVDNCLAALDRYHTSISHFKSVRASEEIAQADLRRQYELNYFEIAKDFGKRYANRFFPVIHSGKKQLPNEETEEKELSE